MIARRTAAAERILQQAVESARQRASARIEPIDVFAALLADESRGATLLAGFGISADDSVTAGFLAESLKEDLDRVSLNPEESTEYAAVVDAAKRQAALGGRTAEMGSEHLAFGLAESPSSVRTHLEERGLTVERIRSEFDDDDSFGEPIPTDLVLEAEATAFDRRHVLRAIDAAANRSAEGLRVAEDYARFIRDDAHLTRLLKNLRHAVVNTLSAVPLTERLAARDTRGDVGTEISSPSAQTRHLESDLLAANVHRAEESLRSLEEFGRLIDPSLGPAFEKLRYELYTIEKAIAASTTANERLAGKRLYVLLTLSHCVRKPEDVIREAAAGGATIFQVREKSMRDRELLTHLKMVRRWTSKADALLIVNDRPDLALLCGADGVHVGQEELTVREVRRIVGSDRIVGVSTHDLEQTRTAALDGADYLGIGPVFASRSKSFDAFAGLAFVSEVAAEISLPWYAIGGIGPENISSVRTAGAIRVAVSAAVCAARDPCTASAELSAALASDRA